MLKTVYFDDHHRHKWQCFRIRLVDKKKFNDRQYDSDVVLLDPTAIALINITKQKNPKQLQTTLVHITI